MPPKRLALHRVVCWCPQAGLGQSIRDERLSQSNAHGFCRNLHPNMPSRKPPWSLRKVLDRARERAAARGDNTTVLKERYELIQEVGRGAFGAVYQAVDLHSSETVAVKLMHEHAVSDEVKVRMQREARAMAQLAGTWAVGIRVFDETLSGQPFLVMDFLEGHNLKQLLYMNERQGLRMSPRELTRIMRPLIATLSMAHERGIIHRDLKPENIFVLATGGNRATRLLDFGLVKDLSLEKLTAVGMVAGSPSYIAPEAWAGRPDRLDHRIDIYALGVIIFRSLAGKTPFERNDNIQRFIATVTLSPRPSLQALRPELHASIDQWTRQALAREPGRRFQTVQALWEALQQVFTWTEEDRS